MWLLQNVEQSIGAIAESLGLSLPNISQHLRILRNQDAVTNDKFIQGCKLIRQGIVENHRSKERTYEED